MTWQLSTTSLIAAHKSCSSQASSTSIENAELQNSHYGDPLEKLSARLEAIPSDFNAIYDRIISHLTPEE